MNNDITLNNKKEYCSMYVKTLTVFFILVPMGTIHIPGLGSILKLIGLVPVAVWALQKHSIKHTRLMVSVLCFVGVCALSCLFTIAWDDTIGRVKTQLSFALLIISALAYEYSIYEIDILKKALLYASRFTAIITILFGDFIEGRLYLNGIVQEDPNYLCGYFLFGISFCLITILSKDRVKTNRKILYGVELLIYFCLVISTGSRGGLLATGICIVLIVILLSDKKTINAKHVIGFFVFAAIIVVVLKYIATNYINSNVLLRFSQEAILQSNGTGRFDIWQNIIQIFSDSSFFRQAFGYGTGSVMATLELFSYNSSHVAHNIYVETLIELGAFGLAVYLIMIFSFIKKAISIRDIFALCIMIGMATLALSTSLNAFKPYWDIMIFICCASQRNYN